MSLLNANLPLASLLEASGINPVDLSMVALQKASDMLQPLLADEENVLQCVETLLFLLPQVSEGSTIEIGKRVVRDLCDPYLRALCGGVKLEQGRLAAHTRALGALLSVLVQRDAAVISLGEGIVKIFTNLLDGLSNQRVCESEESEDLHRKEVIVDPTILITILDHFLKRACPDRIEKTGFSLSPLFDSALKLLQHCDLPVCYLLSTSLLPLLLTTVHLERVDCVWQFVVQVRGQRLHINSLSFDLTLTLLCCFSDVFISYSHTSPFLSRLQGVPLQDGKGPVRDLRAEPLFWSIVQEGLASPESLSRKRCMFLVQCVLASVRGAGGGEEGVASVRGAGGGKEGVASGGWVFWWSATSDEALRTVWDDLILILQTMEEKQVKTLIGLHIVDLYSQVPKQGIYLCNWLLKPVWWVPRVATIHRFHYVKSCD